MMEAQRIELDIDKKQAIRQLTMKQTGNREKPFCELYQNAADAHASKIIVELTDKFLKFADNGDGMNYDDIMTRIRVICHAGKSENEDDIGEFGVGRLQAYNLGESTVVTHKLGFPAYKFSINLKESYDFLLEEIEVPDNLPHGTIIKIVFYNPLKYSWSVEHYIDSYKNAILPKENLSITFNGEEYHQKVDRIDDLCDHNFFIFEGYVQNEIFSQNIRVCSNSVSTYYYSINCLNKMDLNQARNEFISTSDKTKLLEEKINQCELFFIKKDKKFDKTKSSKIISLLYSKRIDYNSIKDKKLIPQTNGKFFSLEELRGKKILYGKSSIWSDDCISQGFMVIDSDFINRLREISTFYNLGISFDSGVKNYAHVGFHNPFSVADLPLKNQKFFYIAKELNKFIFEKMIGFDNIRGIKLGDSDISNAWTDGRYRITISKNFIMRLKNIDDAILKLWRLMTHEYSHDESTIEDDYHNSNFYEVFHDLIQDGINYIPRALEVITYKHIKLEYGV